jgi:acyl-CoA hydrolase
MSRPKEQHEASVLTKTQKVSSERCSERYFCNLANEANSKRSCLKRLCMKTKTAKESLSISTDLVLPSDTNALSGMFGGELLSRMDRVCCIAAQRHSAQIAVTVAVNHVAFNKTVPIGSTVTIAAKVSRAFGTSMEIYADVWIEDRFSGHKTKVNEGIYTFVALGADGEKITVPKLVPETDLEKERFEAALRRRQLSLVLSGKLKAADANELKSLFV